MEAPMKELQDIFIQISGCRDCGLPDGYCPQLRPPAPQYRAGGVVFVQINPGHVGSMTAREIERRYTRQHNRDIAMRKAKDTQKLLSLQLQFVENPSEANYDSMREAFLSSMLDLWGWPPGKYGSTIQAHGVSLEKIAVINLAQCPVPDDSYKRNQLEQCWTKWTSQMIAFLEPSIIVAQGTQVWKFLRKRMMPVKAKLIEGVHHADRKSNKEKQRRFLTVRETMG
jgi:hypothetical protein